MDADVLFGASKVEWQRSNENQGREPCLQEAREIGPSGAVRRQDGLVTKEASKGKLR